MINSVQNNPQTLWPAGERVRAGDRTETKTEVKPDLELEAFRQKLAEGGGTGSSIQRLNLEKIEKIIEEKKQELLEKYGLTEGAKPPLSGEAYAKAAKSMNEELSDFIKQLMEQLALKDGIKKEPGGLIPRGTLISALA